MSELLGQLVGSMSSTTDYDDLYDMGTEIGMLYTDHGFPIDMALERLEYSKDHKISILGGALHWLVIHKRQSGASEKAIARQRKANTKIMESFIKTGETGVY